MPKKPKEKKSPLVVHLEPDQRMLMEMLSGRTGMSLALITRRALDEYLEEFRDAVRVGLADTRAADYASSQHAADADFVRGQSEDLARRLSERSVSDPTQHNELDSDESSISGGASA